MTAQLVFWITGGALALLLAMPHRAKSKWAVMLVAACPPVLVVACLLSGTAFGDLRLRVLAIEASRLALTDPLSIGGHAPDDDLVVSGLPKGLIRVERSPAAVRWAIHLPALDEDGMGGAVQVEDADRNRHFVGSHPLEAGDVICVSRCGSPGAVSFRLRDDQTGLERIDAAELLPAFRRRPLATVFGVPVLEELRLWDPARGIYPLRDYGVRWQGVTHSSNPCGRRFLCREDGRTPVRSFIYFDDGFHVLLLDPGSRVQRGGRVVYAWRDGPVRLREDFPLRQVTLYSVVYGDAYVDVTESPRPASRLRYRAQLTPIVEPDRVRLFLSRPRVTVAERTEIDLAAERVTAAEPVRINLLGAPPPDGPSSAVNPLHIEALGGGIGANLSERLVLDEQTGYGRSGNRFALSGRSEPVRLGVPFTVGSADPVRAARVQIDRLDLPFLMLVVALIWALVFGWAAGSGWRDRPMLLLLIGVAQWLVAIRFLAGLESALYNPRLELASAIGGNIAAYVAVPLALAAFAERGAEQKEKLLPAILFAAGVLVAATLIYGDSRALAMSGALVAASGIVCLPGRWRYLAGAALVAVAAGVLLDWRLGLVLALIFVAGGFAIRRFRPKGIRDRAARSNDEGKPKYSPGVWWVVVAILCLAGGRLAAYAIWGISERLAWSINLSILYVPAVILALGVIWAAIVGGAENGKWWAALKGGRASLVAFIAVGAVVAVGDEGFAIYAIPVVLVGAVVGWIHARRAWTFGWLAVPVSLGLLVIVALVASRVDHAEWQSRLTGALAEARSPEPEARETAGERVAGLLAEANRDAPTTLRIFGALAPERLAMAGTSDAENQRRVAAILADYTSSTTGRGYFVRSDPGEITSYQADDNVSAVHIMSPFGRVGAIVLLLVLGMLARAGTLASDATHWLGLSARLALWTIFALAAYMVLANLYVVPFTGRNIYLLAALSVSDMVEGLILLLIAARGLESSA